MSDIEKRYLTGNQVEVREKDGKPEIRMRIFYNSLSEDLGGFREKISPGFFTDSLVNRDVMSFWNHDSSRPLGRKSNNTLRWYDGKDFLDVVVTPPDTSWSRDALVALKDGLVRGASFSFRATKAEWDEETTPPTRTLVSGDVFEFSPVSEPAYPSSDSIARSLEAKGINVDGVRRALEARAEKREADPNDLEAVRGLANVLTAEFPAADEPQSSVDSGDVDSLKRKRMQINDLEVSE